MMWQNLLCGLTAGQVIAGWGGDFFYLLRMYLYSSHTYLNSSHAYTNSNSMSSSSLLISCYIVAASI